jgi:glycerate-2-kinase
VGNVKLSFQSPLLEIWRKALLTQQPGELVGASPKNGVKRISPGAHLFWGKASRGFADAVYGKALLEGLRLNPEEMLVVCGHGDSLSRFPAVEGDHPVPGKGSLEAGARIVEFFDHLRVMKTRHLTVWLSGGASSLAWIPKVGGELRGPMDLEVLGRETANLYNAGLSIDALNRRRAELCALKGGGATRLLAALAPFTKLINVYLVSDVLPYGPEVVGSGPFWREGKTERLHEVLASNESLVDECVRLAEKAGFEVALAQSGLKGPWQAWVKRIEAAPMGKLSVLGGEPWVKVPRSLHARGGRMAHLAAALALKHLDSFLAGELEILCASSDGRDGLSGSAAFLLNRKTLKNLKTRRQICKKHLTRFDSRAFFEELGNSPCIPEFISGTNLQDVILVRKSGRDWNPKGFQQLKAL